MTNHDQPAYHAPKITTHHHITLSLSDELTVFLRQAVAHITQEIRTMSGTLSEQLDAATAAIQADVAAVAAEVATLLAGMTPGDAITQAQVDALNAIDASLKAIPPVPAATA